MNNIEQMPIAGRERVCCYITRGRELLVFEHDQEYDDGAVGIQVVGGGVDEGETLEQAAIHETFEESGLVLERAVFLGTSRRESTLDGWKGHQQVRHYFWLEAPPETPDSWSHTVSSGELDKGMVFHHRFVALEEANLMFELDECLEELLLEVNETYGDWTVIFSLKDLIISAKFGSCKFNDTLEVVKKLMGLPNKYVFGKLNDNLSIFYGGFEMGFTKNKLKSIIGYSDRSGLQRPYGLMVDLWFLESACTTRKLEFELRSENVTFKKLDDDHNPKIEYTSNKTTGYLYFKKYGELSIVHEFFCCES